MTEFIDLTLNGISTGAIYAAVALALVLIWRATRIVNFAQGAMMMFTTFIALAAINWTGSYILGLVVALVSGFCLGAVVERVLIRRVEGGPPLNAVIVTLGLYTLLVDQNARSALSIAERGVVLNLGRVVADMPASELAADERLRHAYLGF